MATKNHTPESGAAPEHTSTPQQIDSDALRSYIQSREKIDKHIDFIMVFTGILSQYKECAGDEVLVDLYAIGYVNQMLHGKVLEIVEELDRFLLPGVTMKDVKEEKPAEA